MSGIIVGVDGSGHSQRALEWAVREAGLRQTSLTVLTVHQALVGWGGGPVSYPMSDDSSTEQAGKQAQRETDQVLEGFAGERPTEVTVRAVHGLPAEELLHAADGADMIVMGSRGTGGFARLLLGSVTSQVAHHAHCPVVIIPADKHQ
jgi:nucleotide-binding universal stress UspA family protein